jgi:hypothetical protein
MFWYAARGEMSSSLFAAVAVVSSTTIFDGISLEHLDTLFSRLVFFELLDSRLHTDLDFALPFGIS